VHDKIEGARRRETEEMGGERERERRSRRTRRRKATSVTHFPSLKNLLSVSEKLFDTRTKIFLLCSRAPACVPISDLLLSYTPDTASRQAYSHEIARVG
jgi:hypothetical protein